MSIRHNIKIKIMKTRIEQGEVIELTNGENDATLFKGHQNRFCLMLNGKVIKSTISFKPIQNKLDTFSNLEEI
jgi:hypothetical protein